MVEKEIEEEKEGKLTEAYGWGVGKGGQLGFGGSENMKTPIKVTKLPKTTAGISCGGQFTLTYDRAGLLYGFGNNQKYRMGLEKGENYLIPTQIGYMRNIVQVACGDWHSVVRDREGGCWGVGYNKNGCLGLGYTNSVDKYARIEGVEGIDISCGRNITLIVNVDHILHSAGIAHLHGNKKKSDQISLKPIKSLISTEIIGISAGFGCCAAVSSTEVYTWGSNTFYQLGQGKNKSDIKCPKVIESLKNTGVVQISCSRGDKYCHMGCTTKSGDIYTWGSGYKGKLGHCPKEGWSHKDSADEYVPRKMAVGLPDGDLPVKFVSGGIHNAVLGRDGFAYTFGCGSDGRIGHPEIGHARYLYKEPHPKRVEGVSGRFACDLASSYYHMVVLTWGRGVV